jgi:hypothetical protein
LIRRALTRERRRWASALAFRVLAHAELEAYLDERGVEVAKFAWDGWCRFRVATATALALIAFCPIEMGAPPNTLEPPMENRRKDWPERIAFAERLRRAVTDYVHRISQENHEIKQQNLLSILLPIGLHHDAIDPILLERLNAFGSARGQVAHKSSAIAVREGVDPSAELGSVNEILERLRSLDEAIEGIISTALPVSRPSA